MAGGCDQLDQEDFSQVLSHEELLQRWPRDPDGQPERPVFLVNIQEDAGLAAEMAVTQLEAYGIPVLRKYPWGGSVVRLYLGTARTGADLYVPASRLEEARQLLEAAPEADSSPS